MPGLVLADQPVVHARPDEGRYGFASHLAIGDADLIMMPIRRRLVASYTVQRMANFTLKTERGLRVINAALCRNAVKHQPCHLDDAPDTSQDIRYRDQYPASALSDGTLKWITGDCRHQRSRQAEPRSERPRGESSGSLRASRTMVSGQLQTRLPTTSPKDDLGSIRRTPTGVGRGSPWRA